MKKETAMVDGVMSGSLTERRAEFVYEAARLAALAANAPIVPAPWVARENAFRVQFLKVIERQMGPLRSASPEELHGSWMQAYHTMGWVYGERYDRDAKTHPDLVPYSQLGALERDKDSVFVALCDIARQWIRDGAERVELLQDADLLDGKREALSARVRELEDAIVAWNSTATVKSQQDADDALVEIGKVICQQRQGSAA